MIYVGGAVGLRNKGDYSAATTYFPNDFVFYNGATFVAKQATVGNLPTNATYWSVMAGSTGLVADAKWGSD